MSNRKEKWDEMLNRVQSQMQKVSSHANLPAVFSKDVLNCASQIKYWIPFGGAVFVVHSGGAEIVPIRVGAAPIWITRRLFGKYRQDVKCFHVTDKGVKPVSHEEAERLVYLPPEDLTVVTKEQAEHLVQYVLERGVNLGVWGIFEAPYREPFEKISQWQEFFATTKNQVMIAFLRKASLVMSGRVA